MYDHLSPLYAQLGHLAEKDQYAKQQRKYIVRDSQPPLADLFNEFDEIDGLIADRLKSIENEEKLWKLSAIEGETEKLHITAVEEQQILILEEQLQQMSSDEMPVQAVKQKLEELRLAKKKRDALMFEIEERLRESHDRMDALRGFLSPLHDHKSVTTSEQLPQNVTEEIRSLESAINEIEGSIERPMCEMLEKVQDESIDLSKFISSIEEARSFKETCKVNFPRIYRNF